MTIKICVVNIQAEEVSQLFNYYAQQVSSKVLNPGTEVDTKSPKPGVTRIFGLTSSYISLLNKREIIEKIIEAEDEGYDAVVVHCFADPGVHEAREIVNIPVIGPGQSAMLLACMLGHKFGVISLNHPRAFSELGDMITLYGIRERAIVNPIRLLKMPFKEFVIRGSEAHEEVIQDVMQRAEECVADGAEVVVIGCTGLGPLCTMSGIAKIKGSDVPVIDPLAVALKTAEAFVELKTRLDLPSVSRAGMYVAPSEKDLKSGRATFGLRNKRQGV